MSYRYDTDDQPTLSELLRDEPVVDESLDEADFPLSPEEEEIVIPDYAVLDLDAQHEQHLARILTSGTWCV